MPIESLAEAAAEAVGELVAATATESSSKGCRKAALVLLGILVIGVIIAIVLF